MAFACRLKLEHGEEVCFRSCPVRGSHGVFRYVRIESPDAIPPVDERAVDVAVLDMNHGWPNLGHDSLVHAIREMTCDFAPVFDRTGLHVRVLSYDVRRRGMVPEKPGGRFSLFIGTGGPGHLDPRQNDGVSEGTQGIRENPSWEEPVFALFDAILEHPDAALIAVCHTFGVMCRWSGIARPVLRGPEKGGKSTGILENLLTSEALDHPWFRRFSRSLPDGRRLRIVDSRLYDLLPVEGALPAGMTALAHETLGVGGAPGEALTMVELARDPGGIMPRVFAANHHPEVLDRARQMQILKEKRERGEVTPEWYEERARIIQETLIDADLDRRLCLTSEYTLLGPVRFHLHRCFRRRAEALGLRADVHENEVLQS